jgi:hypothetical protein
MALLVLTRLDHILSSDIYDPQRYNQIDASLMAIILIEFDADATTLPIQLRHRLVSKTWNGVLSHAGLENSSHIS